MASGAQVTSSRSASACSVHHKDVHNRFYVLLMYLSERSDNAMLLWTVLSKSELHRPNRTRVR